MDNSSTDEYVIGRPGAFDLNGSMFAADGFDGVQCPEPGVERTRATTARAQRRPPPEPEHLCMARTWDSGQCSSVRTCGEFCKTHGKQWIKPPNKTPKGALVHFLEEHGVEYAIDMTKNQLYDIMKSSSPIHNWKQWIWLGRVDEEPVPWKGPEPEWLYTVGEYGPWTNTGGGIEWNLDLGMCGKINGTTWKVVAR